MVCGEQRPGAQKLGAGTGLVAGESDTPLTLALLLAYLVCLSPVSRGVGCPRLSYRR